MIQIYFWGVHQNYYIITLGYAQIITILQGGGLSEPTKSDYVVYARPLIGSMQMLSDQGLGGVEV